MVVDDNTGVRTALELLLTPHVRRVTSLSDPALIVETLRSGGGDIVLLDMNFRSTTNDGNEGLFWLGEIRRLWADLPVVLMTAYADIELAVRGIKEGATDFIVKPWDNQRLLSTINQAVSRRSEKNDADSTTEMDWGALEQMTTLRLLVNRIAPTDANILITGENGTGKEVLAREIHRLSNRSGKKFTAVDLGALTPTLFESELFGYKKGAFTGAMADSRGKFTEASGGTLFLDEIGNLPLELQPKLLTVLQSRYVTPVGSTQSHEVDVRLISATNSDLEKMVSDGRFREDLMYRLNTIRLHLAPLRDRREDIRPLSERFMAEYAERYHKTIVGITDAALKKLMDYSWPGNIRQLQHAVEQAVILADGAVLEPDDFSFPTVSATKQTPAEAQTLEEMERAMIEKAIAECGGNMSHAAMRLGITRQTLYNKMKRYGL